jgi:hypothetical protein
MTVAPPLRLAARPSGPSVHTWPLDAIALGELPPGFLSLKGRWKVSAVRSTGQTIRTVEQSARSANPVYNLLLVKGLGLADVSIRVRVLSVSGTLDQGGGVVWRARDGRNYYITRYNPLEDNLRLYTVKGGRRKQLASVQLKVAVGKWFELAVQMEGDHIRVHMDGKKRIDVHDKTFTAPGRVGLWTKADARTHFADLQVEKEERRP